MEIHFPQALMRRLPSTVFFVCAALEALSYAGWHAPGIRIGVFILLTIGAIALARLNVRWLFAAVMIEMVIGSHGRLFFADIGGFSVSLRMVLFAALAIGWGARFVRMQDGMRQVREARLAGPLVLLAIVILFAAFRALARGASPVAIFNDANGYVFILLIPIGLNLFAERVVFTQLLRVLSGAVAWLCAKSLLLLYLFSHAFDGAFLRDVFLWQRKFSLTEITHLSGGAVRIFAASDVLLLPALFLGIVMAWEHRRRSAWLWTALVAAAFLLSLSRSFWLGAVAAVVCMLPISVRLGVVPFARFGRLFAVVLSGFAFAALLLAAMVLVPLPKRVQDASAWNAYTGRFLSASDAAVSSRWKMIEPLRNAIAVAPLLGSGFGAEISYQSDDPRMHDLYPGGKVTTSAIEWQYLEIWLKMGMLGLATVAWIWWRIGALLWKALKAPTSLDRCILAGLMTAFFAFIVANVFTPYVNHPLGWALLSFVIIGAQALKEREQFSAV